MHRIRASHRQPIRRGCRDRAAAVDSPRRRRSTRPRTAPALNTPTHALLNLALLARRARRDDGVPATAPPVAPVLLGAILPDVAILVLWAVATFVWRQPQQLTWSETYFRPEWQHAVDTLHSFPIVGVALAACLVMQRATSTRVQAAARWGVLLCASMLLHATADLLTHVEDAHHHLWPLSDWRFASPVSYWDPRHGGLWFAPLESLGALALLPTAWRLLHGRAARTGLGALALVYVVGLGSGIARLVSSDAARPAGSLQGAVTGRR